MYGSSQLISQSAAALKLLLKIAITTVISYICIFIYIIIKTFKTILFILSLTYEF